MTGGFSRAVHVIETAKGWATDTILAMPLCRVRQVLELIIQDKREQLKFQAQLVEWQTKNLAAMFSVAARDSKQAREINKAVKKMNLPLTDEDADIKGRELKVIDDEVQASTEEDYENLDGIDMTEQPSFEELMGAFGDMDTEGVVD